MSHEGEGVTATAERPSHLVQSSFVARALTALARLVADVDPDLLSDAARADSDYAVLLRALERPEALAELRAQDPLAPARLRGLREKEWVLQAEGGTVVADEAAALLGISRQAVDKRRKSGALIGLTLGRRGYAYPTWQFGREGEGTLSGLSDVLSDLRGHGHSPWAQAVFMLSANTRLDGDTALNALRAGRIDEVRRAARTMGEHGAA